MWTKIKDRWAALSGKTRLAIICVAGGLIVGAVLL